MKHAYLILAHTNWNQLKRLINLLDDSRNDIYLHLDKKHFPDKVLLEDIVKSAHLSKVYCIDSISVQWGGFSIVKAEFRLLKSAVKGDYDYYHLLSGMDLPLKSQDEIDAFFEKNIDKEYIHFGTKEWMENKSQRYRFYWLTSGDASFGKRVCYKLEKKVVWLQELIHVDRLNGRQYASGSQWFSITNQFAQYICSHEKEILRRYHYTRIGDESFIQSIALESGFFDKCFHQTFDDSYYSSMRYIDWERGKPYVYRSEDFSNLIHSEYLFARKFDETIDINVINSICNYLGMEV